MDNPVIIFGAGGLGRAALEIFQSNDIVVYGFLDDNKELHNTEIDNVTVLGKTDDDGFLKLIGKKCEAFIAVDDNKLRKGLTKLILDRRKMMPVNAHHKSAMLAPSAHLGHGNFINAGVVLGAGAKIGNHCLLHSRAVVDHNCVLGDYVQVGAGSVLNAEVQVEEGTFIGSGVTIVSGVKIGKNARIGAGSVVIRDVKKGETVFGNPAQVVKA
jgi:sugar O-acyltransferase (sialic acid O-acetyltransferase NeuD family)